MCNNCGCNDCYDCNNCTSTCAGGCKVCVSEGDTADYLSAKLTGTGLAEVTVVNPGSGNEHMNVHVPNIVSTDGSIGISTTIDGDIDLSGCCPDPIDEKVSVGPSCPGDYLPNVLVPAAGSPITLTVVGCRYEIDVDLPGFPDEKVKVDSTCPSVYLEDAIQGQDGVLSQKTGCTIVFSIDPNSTIWQKPSCRKTIDETYEITQPLLTSNSIQITGFTEVEETTSSGMAGTTDALVAPKDGFYRLDMNGRVEIRNDGVSAARVFNVSTNLANSFRIDESWASTRQGPDQDLAPPRNPYYGVNGSLSNFAFGQSVILYMQQGEEIRMFVRMSNNPDASLIDPGTTNGRLRIRGNNGTPGSPVPGGGGGINMSLTWLSDLNGNSLYI